MNRGQNVIDDSDTHLRTRLPFMIPFFYMPNNSGTLLS